MKKFDLAKAKAGAPVQTKLGWKVKSLVFKQEEGHPYPITAHYENGGFDTFTIDGMESQGVPSDYDLAMV